MKVFVLILLLFSVVTYAKPQYGTVTVSKVISVYDGDTFRVDIDSLPPIVGKNIPIRVNGVDTPEIRGKCQYEKNLALEARDFVRAKLANAKDIKLTNLADEQKLLLSESYKNFEEFSKVLEKMKSKLSTLENSQKKLQKDAAISQKIIQRDAATLSSLINGVSDKQQSAIKSLQINLIFGVLFLAGVIYIS